MSLKCILIIKNGQSRGVLEPSFQVVFRIVNQNTIFTLLGPKLGEKVSPTTHNADIFKTLNFCIPILTH